MGVRLKHHEQSALEIARWLADRDEIGAVLHPALPSCPGHQNFARDFKGSSGLFAFVLNHADEASRAAFIDALDLFGFGYSWGGFESLATPADPHRTLGTPVPDPPPVRLPNGPAGPADH